MVQALAAVGVGIGVFTAAINPANPHPPAATDSVNATVEETVVIGDGAIAAFAAMGVLLTPDGVLRACVVDTGHGRDLWIVGNGEWIMLERESGEVMASGTVCSSVGNDRTLLVRMMGPKIIIDGQLSPDASGEARLDFDGRIEWGGIGLGRSSSYACLERSGGNEGAPADGEELVMTAKVCMCICPNGLGFIPDLCEGTTCHVGTACGDVSGCVIAAVPSDPVLAAGGGVQGGGDGAEPQPEEPMPAPPPPRPACQLVDPIGSWVSGGAFVVGALGLGGVVTRRRMR